MKKNKMLIATLGVVGAMLSVLLILMILGAINKYHIEMEDPADVTVEAGEPSVIVGVKAQVRGTIFKRKGEEIIVKASEGPEKYVLGLNTIEYTAKFRDLEVKKTRKVYCVDTTKPVIELISKPGYFTSPVGTYVEEGYKAVDNYDGDITDKVVATEKDGVVTYTVKDSSGNEATVTRTIVYKDVVAPVITLESTEPLVIGMGEELKVPSCTSTDDCDGDVSASIESTNDVDTSKPGTYKITYTAKDSEGNVGTAELEVKVVDRTPPEIKFAGDTYAYVKLNDTYTAPGFTATDNIDGDITSKVVSEGSVDTSKKGTYTVTYSVEDSSGNKATETVTVYVYSPQEDVTIDPGNKVIYLTFDDGPGKYTEQLLDLLDKYNVKVTFFVTNQFPGYQHLIAEEAKRGHTVAIHSLTHEFSIYKSEETYFEDLEAMNDIIEKQTGKRTQLIRFPGGSSNAVSKKYCEGIMTRLVKSVTARGYKFADWNVSSGDAGGTTAREGVAKNVIKGCSSGSKASVVLQHDIKKFSVEATEDIIVWGLANGYTFLPMDMTSPMAHQALNN